MLLIIVGVIATIAFVYGLTLFLFSAAYDDSCPLCGENKMHAGNRMVCSGDQCSYEVIDSDDMGTSADIILMMESINAP